MAVNAAVYYTRISSLWTDERALCEVDYYDIVEATKNDLVDIIQGRCIRRKLVLDAFRYGSPE